MPASMLTLLMPAIFRYHRVPLHVQVRMRGNQRSGGAVEWSHNALIPLISHPFPDNALTNVSPNIVQQMVELRHSGYAGCHAKPVTSLSQLVGRPRFETVFGMSGQYCR